MGSNSIAKLIAFLGAAIQVLSPAVLQAQEILDRASIGIMPGKQEPNLDPPLVLQLRADRQSYSARQRRLVAEGSVSVNISGGLLEADRIEFDTDFNTLLAKGNVRFRRGTQYFQASSFLYNLVQKSGELKDVYGVLNLELTSLDSQLRSGSAGTAWKEDNKLVNAWVVPIDSTPARKAIACPLILPPIPKWRPHPWAVTVWGGQMIDANFGDVFLLNGRMRPEYLLGVSLQRRIWNLGLLSFEVEVNLFGHRANKQAGGPFNQEVPNADTPMQNFAESIIGIGGRLWLQPWLSLGFVEGISYYSIHSNYERTYRRQYARFLNYLGIELEAAVSRRLSVVGRIHHRSGVFRLYSGVKEGSNAYLLGARYRWGQDRPQRYQPLSSTLPIDCYDLNQGDQKQQIKLDQGPKLIILDHSLPRRTPASRRDLSQTNQSDLSPTQQESLRELIISRIDQRVNNIQPRQWLNIEQQFGVPSNVEYNSLEMQNIYRGIKLQQFNISSHDQFIAGKTSRWRIQATRVRIMPRSWYSDRIVFTNDPYTPAQTYIDAKNVTVSRDRKGNTIIHSESSRLVIEELSIPGPSRIRHRQKDDVGSRWFIGIDNKDRGGFYIGRNLRPLEFGDGYILRLQPQFLVQRSFASTVQPNPIASLFGLEARLTGKVLDWNIKANANVSTFNSSNFFNGSRFWGELRKGATLPWIGDVKARLFGTYRYKTWNGSLGKAKIYSSYGIFLEQSGEWEWKKLSNNYTWRAGIGNYRAESSASNRIGLSSSWRASILGSISSSFPVWQGQLASLTPLGAYRYSPVAIAPSLIIRTNINMQLATYRTNRWQNTIKFSAGPVLTLGNFSHRFLDYTQLSVIGSSTLKQGTSLFKFDQTADLRTVDINLTQQIAGPLLASANAAMNIDSTSAVYGNIIDSNVELIWQRRSYNVGLYYNFYKGIGGFRFQLRDFNFTGTGIPFIPYIPADWREIFFENMSVN